LRIIIAQNVVILSYLKRNMKKRQYRVSQHMLHALHIRATLMDFNKLMLKKQGLDEDVTKRKGWEDNDLVDALVHDTNMIDHSIMMQVFRIDQACMVG
jgi:hypothetical protein